MEVTIEIATANSTHTEAILRNIWYGLVLYGNYSVNKHVVNVTVNMLKMFEDSIQTVKAC